MAALVDLGMRDLRPQTLDPTLGGEGAGGTPVDLGARALLP
jgi:hypothetical protein